MATNNENKKMIPGRRSHGVRPMTPAVVPPERRPSASEGVSRPSIQNPTHSAPEGENGRAESAFHSTGDAVSRRLRRWRSQVTVHHFVLTPPPGLTLE